MNLQTNCSNLKPKFKFKTFSRELVTFLTCCLSMHVVKSRANIEKEIETVEAMIGKFEVFQIC